MGQGDLFKACCDVGGTLTLSVHLGGNGRADRMY